MTSQKVPSLRILQLQARAKKVLRAFFECRSCLEVDTPALRFHAAMEPNLSSFRTSWTGPDGSTAPMFLQSSPEYALKMVVAEHQVDIWQLARAFRNEETSSTHLPEFSLLEWYRVGRDYHALMDETEALVRTVAESCCHGTPRFSYRGNTSDPLLPFERKTVRDAFLEHAGLDPLALSGRDDLATAARDIGLPVNNSWSWQDIFHLVLLEKVEPELGVSHPTFLYEYPAQLAALARTKPGDDRVAERCELYICGLELSNGFSELTDAAEQNRRLKSEQSLRNELGKPVLEVDQDLVDAVTRLPECTGNALGWDRLLMLCTEFDDVRELVVQP